MSAQSNRSAGAHPSRAPSLEAFPRRPPGTPRDPLEAPRTPSRDVRRIRSVAHDNPLVQPRPDVRPVKVPPIVGTHTIPMCAESNPGAQPTLVRWSANHRVRRRLVRATGSPRRYDGRWGADFEPVCSDGEGRLPQSESRDRDVPIDRIAGATTLLWLIKDPCSFSAARIRAPSITRHGAVRPPKV